VKKNETIPVDGAASMDATVAIRPALRRVVDSGSLSEIKGERVVVASCP
jgi:hypothetical protein